MHAHTAHTLSSFVPSYLCASANVCVCVTTSAYSERTVVVCYTRKCDSVAVVMQMFNFFFVLLFF